MILLVGLLVLVIILLIIGIIRLRADLYASNWILAKLLLMVLIRASSDVDVWDVVDHATLLNFLEGHMTLADFCQALRKNL